MLEIDTLLKIIRLERSLDSNLTLDHYKSDCLFIKEKNTAYYVHFYLDSIESIIIQFQKQPEDLNEYTTTIIYKIFQGQDDFMNINYGVPEYIIKNTKIVLRHWCTDQFEAIWKRICTRAELKGWTPVYTI